MEGITAPTGLATAEASTAQEGLREGCGRKFPPSRTYHSQYQQLQYQHLQLQVKWNSDASSGLLQFRASAAQPPGAPRSQTEAGNAISSHDAVFVRKDFIELQTVHLNPSLRQLSSWLPGHY